MAGIDKTYTNSYRDYKEFKEWANTQTVTFFNGYKEYIGNWVWDYKEEDFLNEEIPIMNTPTWLDIYLIQNCKSQFVLERMKTVYNKATYQKFTTVDLTTKPPKEFKQNRKITIKTNNKSKFPIHSKPYGSKTKWWLQCNGDFWYHDETRMWVNNNTYYPHNTDTALISSIKSVIRHLRKQYLPKGIVFTISGRYVGEEYSIYIQ
jgi:hypothetical protein